MGILVGFFSIVLVLVFAFWIDSCVCSARFPDIENRYQIISGCMVKTNEGWIPDDRYRVID